MSATLGRERHTNSARVTTAEYPQKELLNRRVGLLRATSASVEMEALNRAHLVYVKLLSLVKDISVNICCVTTIVVVTCNVNITYQSLRINYKL